jgi:hypothetical protein
VIDDRELDWMAALDWSKHGAAQERGVVRKGYIPLATALERLARHAVDVWPESDDGRYFLKCAGLRPRGDWVPAELAFDEDGMPYHSVHARSAPALVADAEYLAVPISSASSVTRDEWESVGIVGGDDWEWGVGARRVWAVIAPAFAQAAFDGRIKTFYRGSGSGGGEPKKLESYLWELEFELAVRRAAACAIYMDNEAWAFDQSLKAEHPIYVLEKGLEATLQAVARETYASALDLGDFGRLHRTIDDQLPAEARIVTRLAHLLTVNDPRTSSKDILINALESDFGCEFSERQRKRYWRLAKAMIDVVLRERYEIPGPKPKAPTEPR